MSLSVPSDIKLSGAGLKVGIAAARFNERHVDSLLAQARSELEAAGVKSSAIEVVRVPGSNELPSALQLLNATGSFDVLIALGVLIRGDTIHYELIAEAATNGLMRLALDTGIPVINGVVVAEKQKQADERCFGKIPRGAEFARSALEMGMLRRRLAKPARARR
jgi:6,7-dimethyl-8-ribityllumazine synthase